MVDKERIQRAEDSLVAHKNRIENFLVGYLSTKVSTLEEVESLGAETGRLIKDFFWRVVKESGRLLHIMAILLLSEVRTEAIFPLPRWLSSCCIIFS